MNENVSLKGTSLLMVEDNNDQWLIAQQAALSALPGVRIDRTATSEEAFTLLQKCKIKQAELPRLILLDLYLPNRADGLEFVRRLKTLGDVFQRVPVVMLSFSSQSEDIGDTYQAGVGSYIVKPQRFEEWVELFTQIRIYWWETVRLPGVNNFLF